MRLHSKMLPGIVAGIAALTGFYAIPAASAQVTITFEADSTGAKPNGFQSVESPLVSFSDTLGADLSVNNSPGEVIGNGLFAFSDDQSAILMQFAGPVGSLSLVFGNDDSRFITPSDFATLTVFQGATQVGQVQAAPNSNDLPDQTISISGVIFDSATFAYSTDLIEAIDNVTFTPVTPGAAAPEPGTVALLAGGGLLAAGGAILRRRRRAA